MCARELLSHTMPIAITIAAAVSIRHRCCVLLLYGVLPQRLLHVAIRPPETALQGIDPVGGEVRAVDGGYRVLRHPHLDTVTTTQLLGMEQSCQRKYREGRVKPDSQLIKTGRGRRELSEVRLGKRQYADYPCWLQGQGQEETLYKHPCRNYVARILLLQHPHTGRPRGGSLRS